MTTSTTTQPSTDYGFCVGTLRDVLAQMKAERPELASRLDRAATLLVTRDVRPLALGDVQGWWVQSEADPQTGYWVTNGALWCCQCKDYELRRAAQCKHCLAVQLLLAALAFEAPDPSAPIAWPVLGELDPDAPIPFWPADVPRPAWQPAA